MRGPERSGKKAAYDQLGSNWQAGQGTTHGERAGNLYLEIEIRQDRQFRVDVSDVYIDLPSSRVTVPVPSGDIDLKIPAGSNQGRKLRLKGKGIPGKQPGDCYAVLDVELLRADSDDAKALYEQMSQEMSLNPRASL